jgi:hypothetical protein
LAVISLLRTHPHSLLKPYRKLCLPYLGHEVRTSGPSHGCRNLTFYPPRPVRLVLRLRRGRSTLCYAAGDNTTPFGDGPTGVRHGDHRSVLGRPLRERCVTSDRHASLPVDYPSEPRQVDWTCGGNNRLRSCRPSAVPEFTPPRRLPSPDIIGMGTLVPSESFGVVSAHGVVDAIESYNPFYAHMTEAP